MTTDPGIMLFGKNISPFASVAATEDPKTPSIYEDGMPENSPTTEGDTISLSSPTTLTKPDKILPCPRCESLNTKFCYFNNSNVSQPRHFCKSCQRYWTAGGTMRSMPVGAGRRKKKNNPQLNCRYIISQEDFESDAGTAANQIDFGQNSPQFEAGISGKENKENKENREVCSSGDNNGFHPSFNWIPMPIPIYPQIPMYPSPYWSSVSWLPHTNSVLGKHPADEESTKPNDSSDFKKQRSSILTPKTLRIQDPDEAAKSSIWVTLGITNEHNNRGDLFKGFQSKGKNIAAEPSPVLQANPAAFSRSLWFQERA